jgi:hypothetical protein
LEGCGELLPGQQDRSSGERPKGKNHCVMRKIVPAAWWLRQSGLHEILILLLGYTGLRASPLDCT